MTEYTFKKIGGKVDSRVVADPEDVKVAAYHQHHHNPMADEKTNYYNGEKELMRKRKEELEGLSLQEESLEAPKTRAPKVSFAKKPEDRITDKAPEDRATDKAPEDRITDKAPEDRITDTAPKGKTIKGPDGSYAKGPALGVHGTSKPYDGLTVTPNTPKKEETPKGKVKTSLKENKRKDLKGCLTFFVAAALIAAAVYGAHWLGTFNAKKAEEAQLKNKSNMEQFQGAETTEVSGAKAEEKSDTPTVVQMTTVNVQNNINNETYNNSTVIFNNGVTMPEGSDVSQADEGAPEEANVTGRSRYSPSGAFIEASHITEAGKKINIVKTRTGVITREIPRRRGGR